MLFRKSKPTPEPAPPAAPAADELARVRAALWHVVAALETLTSPAGLSLQAYHDAAPGRIVETLVSGDALAPDELMRVLYRGAVDGAPLVVAVGLARLILRGAIEPEAGRVRLAPDTLRAAREAREAERRRLDAERHAQRRRTAENIRRFDQINYERRYGAPLLEAAAALGIGADAFTRDLLLQPAGADHWTVRCFHCGAETERYPSGRAAGITLTHTETCTAAPEVLDARPAETPSAASA